ncbi:MAG: site-specific DNA-methyltransferase, partial [Bacteroidia bacterium]|nr:site-specific DNA-methyltransferase [Bacteroidia bacterium]
MTGKSSPTVDDLRHPTAQRPNNPPAGLMDEQRTAPPQRKAYAYDPYLDPQLVWAGKEERSTFEVDILPLHTHERIAPKAIIEALQRPEPPQPSLFGEASLPLHKQIELYRHTVPWANRLILGDSLLVMNSLLHYEGLAGQVQMIYIDPPYGIKFSSNFQPRIDRRDVRDKPEDLTHEPEQIQAYRDTWQLGIHSYLTYLRDRLLLARELLADSGSIFVQINDENLHLVRCLLDEVFGRDNFVSLITFTKTSGQSTKLLPSISDYIIWYAKEKEKLKYRPLYWHKEHGPGYEAYRYAEFPNGVRVSISSSDEELRSVVLRRFRLSSITSQGYIQSSAFELTLEGKKYKPPANRHWATSQEGIERLAHAERLIPAQSTINFVRYLDDFPYYSTTNVWTDVGSISSEKLYVVQTATKVVERCILMTTDPGDLVFDPTCGSGTTAYAAEKWGRRWITCDTSRVAIAIARQRLMTAKFDYYELKDPEQGPAGGFVYETVPHITLESIAKNEEIDAIAEKYQPQIEEALAELNQALKGHAIRIRISRGGRAGEVVDFAAPDSATHTLPTGQVVRQNELLEWEVPLEVPHPLWPPQAVEAYRRLLAAKQSPLSGQSVEEDLRIIYQHTGHRWEKIEEVPEPIPGPDWPEAARQALRRFWELRRQKRHEIEESIRRRAPQETLYDRPKVVKGRVRVSGPFTVEALPLPIIEDPQQALAASIPQGYYQNLINLLIKQGGVNFSGQLLALENVRPLQLGHLHAEAEAEQNGEKRRVAISFGPPYGFLSAVQAYEARITARSNGYQMLLLIAFGFDPELSPLLEKHPVKDLEVHTVFITPDVLVGDLLKATRASQIFSAIGQPDVEVYRCEKGRLVPMRKSPLPKREEPLPEPCEEGTYLVELRGVDIYDPVTGKVYSDSGKRVAAWFLDTDYDGQTFHVSQAFFPADAGAWEKLQRALKAQINPEAFEQ